MNFVRFVKPEKKKIIIFIILTIYLSLANYLLYEFVFFGTGHTYVPKILIDLYLYMFSFSVTFLISVHVHAIQWFLLPSFLTSLMFYYLISCVLNFLTKSGKLHFLTLSWLTVSSAIILTLALSVILSGQFSILRFEGHGSMPGEPIYYTEIHYFYFFPFLVVKEQTLSLVLTSFLRIINFALGVMLLYPAPCLITSLYRRVKVDT